ncbi:hypothetical protein KKH43_04890 [Patescibacteria group bacterium]|nr:hypothetical protein [Patescibacteria group bacterium]
MTIAICGSLDFTKEIKKLADELKSKGFTVKIPLTSEKILKGQLTVQDIKKEKKEGQFAKRAIKYDSIRKYWNIIVKSDVILVANYDKNDIKNYIGGNSFLEMGFAHVLEKPIYLLNGIPKIMYRDEIEAMQPISLKGTLENLHLNP